jgi:flagellar biosynthesis/type III secretory pathway M-ring protein FliF/YscJ
MIRLNRYVLILCFVVVAFGLIVAGYYKVMFDIQRKRAEAAAAEIAATKRALEASEVYTRQTIIIREKGNAATQRIYKAPEAATAVPDDVLSAWRDGIDSLRDDKSADPASVP